MATTTSTMICPNCKSEECIKTVDSLRLTWSAFCLKCGYDYLSILKRDEEGKVMVKDQIIGTDEWDNIIKKVEEEGIDPYGCFEYKFSNGVTFYESIPTEEIFNEMIQGMNTSFPDLVSIKLSRYVEGELYIKTIFSK